MSNILFPIFDFNSSEIKEVPIQIFTKDYYVCFRFLRYEETSVDAMKNTYDCFCQNSEKIIYQIEHAVAKYCNDYLLQSRTTNNILLENEDLSNIVKPIAFAFYDFSEYRLINVLFDFDYDLENGIGVQVKNEEVVFVGKQYEIL